MNIPKDPFDGHFKKPEEGHSQLDRLLTFSSARRMLGSLHWGSRNDLYVYQQPLEKKSGPWVYLEGRPYRMVSSYDYLGLIGHPAIEAAAVEAVRTYGTGTGGVRLLTGTTELHCLLEKELAAFKGTGAAVTFSSGYLANLAAVTTLFGTGDRILIDSRAHRSIVEACRLSRVETERFEHNDTGSLKTMLDKRPHGRRTLVIIEGVYSMDGDLCPLPEIVALKGIYDFCLMVDEAHSLGVLGPGGRGVDAHFGVPAESIDIWTGSLSKAIPSNGGFIAGSRDLVYFLQHAAAPFIFSAALCPAAVAASREALRVIREEPERLDRLRSNAVIFREGLAELGYDTGVSESPIIPVIVRKDEHCLRLARRLFSLGIVATPIVKPAVSPGGARIRLCATAAQDESFLRDVVEGFRKAGTPHPGLPKPAPAKAKSRRGRIAP